jgi:hypothetical protein
MYRTPASSIILKTSSLVLVTSFSPATGSQRGIESANLFPLNDAATKKHGK